MNINRLIILSLFVLAGSSYAQNTLPVIPFGERKADLYYWDTNWVDRYEHLHPNEAAYPAEVQYYFPSDIGDYFVARACYADTPILVRGIAGAVDISPLNNYMLTLDTSLSGRLPEWFYLYSSDYTLLGEGRWDTVPKAY